MFLVMRVILNCARFISLLVYVAIAVNIILWVIYLYGDLSQSSDCQHIDRLRATQTSETIRELEECSQLQSK